MYYSDEPSIDFERHSAAQEEKLKRAPICDECGQPIQDDFYYEIDGNKYCEECINNCKVWNEV